PVQEVGGRAVQPVLGMDVDADEIGLRPGGQAGRPPDQGLTAGGAADGNHDPLPGLPRPVEAVAGPVALEALLHPVGDPQEGQLPEGGQVSDPEVVGQGDVEALGVVDVAVGQPAPQGLGRHVDQLDLVGGPDEGVGDGLRRGNTGDLLADVGQRLEVGDVERRDDVDAGLEELVDVFPALGVAAAGGVGVGQLVDEHHVGPAGEDGVEVHLLDLGPRDRDAPPGHHRKVTQLGGGAGPAVRLHETGHHVGAALRPPPALAEHGERLAHARRRPEVDPQAAPGHPGVIVPFSRLTSSYTGLRRARRPRLSPAVPSTRRRTPTSIPAMARRPRKTIEMAPVSSTSTHSSVGTSARGWTRSDRTLPSIRTCGRKRTLPMGTPLGGAVTATAPAGAGTGRACAAVSGGSASSTGRSAAGARRAPNVLKWNGTAVTLAWGSSETSRSMVSAVRSWRIRCQSPRYLRSGSRTLTSVSPSARSRATVSTAQRLSRRSGQSTSSRGMRRSPRRCHSSDSLAAWWASITKWTARTSFGVSARAYWMARAEARSSWSTKTRTVWRRSTGTMPASGTPCSSASASSAYGRARRTRNITMTGTSTTMIQAPWVNLVTAMTMSTTADSTAPTPLTTRPLRQWGSWWVMWCLAIPAWDSVKEVNTPMA